MNQPKRYSSAAALQGCFVSWLCMVLLMLSISFFLTSMLKLISTETERLVGLFVWHLSICAGGYYAARRGEPAGWVNALFVGLLAELFVCARLLKGTSVFEIMDDPGPHWRRLLALGLTIPAAILGGVIWEMTKGVPKPETVDASGQ
jgi:putative membrane protein (TIGR04086 family)